MLVFGHRCSVRAFAAISHHFLMYSRISSNKAANGRNLVSRPMRARLATKSFRERNPVHVPENVSIATQLRRVRTFSAASKISI